MASGPSIPETAVTESSITDVRSPQDAAQPTAPVSGRDRVQYFRRADGWFNRLVRLASAVHEGFWLGCLSAEDLNAVTAGHYEQSREYSSPEHNQRGLFDWEAAALNRYFQPGSRILVAAAGGGREILALRRAGFQA